MLFFLPHGPNGEDGTVQALLEALNLPDVGNGGLLFFRTGMDKVYHEEYLCPCRPC